MKHLQFLLDLVLSVNGQSGLDFIVGTADVSKHNEEQLQQKQLKMFF